RAGRDGENEITVDRRVSGTDGASNAVLCGDGETLELSFRESRVGCDNGDRGARDLVDLIDPVGADAFRLGGVDWSGMGPKAAKLSADLKRGGPEIRPLPGRDTSHRIHSNERPNREALVEHGRARSQAALEVRGARADTGAGSADLEIHRGGLERPASE